MTHERLEKDLREALVHLYDPDYQPSERVYALTACDPRNGPIPVQSAIIQAIERLKPAPDVPVGARVRQIYDVMFHRYILRVTQEGTAEVLNISVRSLHRAQREGVHALAQVLWEHHRRRERPAAGRSPRDEAPSSRGRPPDDQAPDWRSQARQELVSLRTSAPDTWAEVEETIREVLELEEALASVHGVRVELGFVQPDLVAMVHPAALRQILITALGQLARHMVKDPITIYAGLEDGRVKITLTGTVPQGYDIPDGELARDILAPTGGAVEVHQEGDSVFLWIRLPSSGEITVLVVDDNPDMVHFYRRCTAGTSYCIVHAPGGRHIMETIKTVAPDIIVLDIMLPDVDGWKLLMQLHEHPDTQSIPIVVCSVVREKELALALGAACYLSKPVQPQHFTEALDRVLRRDSAAATTTSANSRAPG